MIIYGVTGWKNSGKTTLTERLVAEFTARGVSVSTVKHAHHSFEIDFEGKDSWRHRNAGAREVLISSGARWALMRELRDAPEPPLEELLEKLSPVDLVLVEGYKRSKHPKIEASRAATASAPLIASEDPSVRAVASDWPIAQAYPRLDAPRFPLDAVSGIADFILEDAIRPAIEGWR